MFANPKENAYITFPAVYQVCSNNVYYFSIIIVDT